jgi:hypothetical protein
MYSRYKFKDWTKTGKHRCICWAVDRNKQRGLHGHRTSLWWGVQITVGSRGIVGHQRYKSRNSYTSSIEELATQTHLWRVSRLDVNLTFLMIGFVPNTTVLSAVPDLIALFQWELCWPLWREKIWSFFTCSGEQPLGSHKQEKRFLAMIARQEDSKQWQN